MANNFSLLYYSLRSPTTTNMESMILTKIWTLAKRKKAMGKQFKDPTASNFPMDGSKL